MLVVRRGGFGSLASLDLLEEAPMPISHFLVRPRRAAAVRTNAAIDAVHTNAAIDASLRGTTCDAELLPL